MNVRLNGPEAREPDVQADLGHRPLGLAQQRHRALESAPLQVAVRRLPERLLERADEVRLGGQRDPRQRRHVERLVVRAVHLVASAQHAAAGGIDPDHTSDTSVARGPRASERAWASASAPTTPDSGGLLAAASASPTAGGRDHPVLAPRHRLIGRCASSSPTSRTKSEMSRAQATVSAHALGRRAAVGAREPRARGSRRATATSSQTPTDELGDIRPV